jgi:O-antigen chain-terminating methyltransferase
LNREWHVSATLSLPTPTSLLGKLLFPVKKFILRALQPAMDTVITQQNEFNAKIVQTFNSLEAQREVNAKIVQTFNGLVELVNSELERVRAEVSHHLQAFQAQFDTFQAQFDTFQAQFDTFQAQTDTFQSQFNTFQSHLDTLQSYIENRLEQIEPRLDASELMVWAFDRRKEALEIEQIFLNQKLEQVLSIMRDQRGQGPDVVTHPLPTKERQEDYTYLVFENIHRGDEQTIKTRMQGYLSYFKDCSNVLDIGCARGEFLELLKEHHIQGYGIDVNHTMVQYCRKKGLEAKEAEALSHLQSLPQNSLDGIFLVHLAEHFSIQDLHLLLQLCFDKLQPHHYLVIETPNPRSLYALSQYFYKDLSHEKPLHPEALQHLVKTVGFQQVQIEDKNPFSAKTALQELDVMRVSDETLRSQLEKINQNIRQLNTLIYGHLDYAVIAKKVKMF